VQILLRVGQVVALQQIDAEVSLDYELGAIVRRSYDLMAPAPLFTNMTGVDPGFRVLGAPAGVSAQPGLYLARVALSLGLAPESTGAEVVAAIVAGREADLIPPRLVSTGPCKEVIAVGDEVDLRRLPAPLLHGTHRRGGFQHQHGYGECEDEDNRWIHPPIITPQLQQPAVPSGKWCRARDWVRPRGAHDEPP
jgi:4-hydroxy-3-polyprenylbenzoate decarboxylase